jgi:predicted amidohydrolase YtcJ
MYADLIVTNGNVLTMDEEKPRAEAVAIHEGRILEIGSAAGILALQGPETELIDAQGGSVLPGFIESHLHILIGAAELGHLQLLGVMGFDALASAVRAFAASKPDAKMLIAQGAEYTILSEHEPVTRHHLDRIVSDRPFAMLAPDHHTMWANTKALEMAGILHGLDVGPGSEVVMGEDGLALGELRELEAMGPVSALAGQGRLNLGMETGGEPVVPPTPEERASDRAVLLAGLRHAARHGITSFHNMDGNAYTLELLSELRDEGLLLCRARVPFHFKSDMTLSDLDRATAMTARFDGEWLTSGFVKLFMDGVMDSWTALLVEPYADRPDWRGEPMIDAVEFARIATEIDRRGLQIAVHAIGDGAVRTVLDGYEAARKANGSRDSRHRVEHISLTTADDIPRFAELGVICSMQPPHPPGALGSPLEPFVSRIGKHRWPLAYVWRALKNTGAHLAFGSDWPVTNIDPILGIREAIVRKPWAPDMPDQSLSLLEAIAGYTVEGAYAEFAETSKGRLKKGYLADIVVLSSDIERILPEALGTVHPVTTICGGKVTFKA